jgi:hypothetical protein
LNFFEKIFGSGIGGFGDAFSKIMGTFKLSPEAKAELEKALAENNFKFAELDSKLELAKLESERASLETINATMREEAKSEHWAQWAWRPVIGFTFSAVIINNYILLPYFRAKGLQPIDIPGGVWDSMLVILGATAALRGWKQVQEAKK